MSETKESIARALESDIRDMAKSIEAVKGVRHAECVLIMFNVWQLGLIAEDHGASPEMIGMCFAAIGCIVESLVDRDKQVDITSDVKMLMKKFHEANEKLGKL